MNALQKEYPVTNPTPDFHNYAPKKREETVVPLPQSINTPITNYIREKYIQFSGHSAKT